MNLYRIIIGHASPKDSTAAITHYQLAEDDVEVYDKIKDLFYLSTHEEWVDEVKDYYGDDQESIDDMLKNEDIMNADGYFYRRSYRRL